MGWAVQGSFPSSVATGLVHGEMVISTIDPSDPHTVSGFEAYIRFILRLEIKLLNRIVFFPVRRLLAEVNGNGSGIVIIIGHVDIVVLKELVVALAGLCHRQ